MPIFLALIRNSNSRLGQNRIQMIFLVIRFHLLHLLLLFLVKFCLPCVGSVSHPKHDLCIALACMQYLVRSLNRRQFHQKVKHYWSGMYLPREVFDRSWSSNSALQHEGQCLYTKFYPNLSFHVVSEVELLQLIHFILKAQVGTSHLYLPCLDLIYALSEDDPPSRCFQIRKLREGHWSHQCRACLGRCPLVSNGHKFYVCLVHSSDHETFHSHLSFSVNLGIH